MQKIILRRIEKPREKVLMQDLNWVCDSFAFSSGRDTDLIANKIVEGIIEGYREHERVNSELLAEELRINQAMVNHHLRNLINAGLIFREKRAIHLRGGSLKSAVEEMRKDANRIFNEIEAIAEDIDERLGLKNRE